MNEIIRLAHPEDAAAILDVYRPFITDTAISFEYTVPSIAEFAERIRGIAAEYPYLVYEREGRIEGYAYAHRYLERAAYQWDVEVTVYLSDAVRGSGIGAKLYTAMEKLLQLQGIINLYACITASNQASINFHAKTGYKMVGTFHKAGFKLGEWQDVVWMEKAIGCYSDKPQEPLPFTALNDADVAAVLAGFNEVRK